MFFRIYDYITSQIFLKFSSDVLSWYFFNIHVPKDFLTVAILILEVSDTSMTGY